MRKFKLIIKPIAFIIIFAFLFNYFSELLCRKTLDGAWNHTTKISGFYNEPQNEFDIMFFGSSNTYCSFNPLVLYEKTGIKSYVFATQQQPVWASYAYMKEALKSQKPKLMVLDILMFSKDSEYYDDGVNYSFMDNIPLSFNKAELAFASAPGLDSVRLLCNFIKYHSRWSELTEEDYKFKRSGLHDYLKGYVLLEDVFADAKPPQPEIEETSVLSEKTILYFNKIVELSKKSGIPLLLVKTPSNVTVDDEKLFNSVKLLAEESGIEYVDFNKNYPEIGLNLSTDFYDKSHLNYMGAEKFTDFFAEYLLSEQNFSECEKKDESWNSDILKYRDYCKNL